MTTGWDRLETAFEQLCELDPDARARVLDALGEDAQHLRRELEHMFAATGPGWLARASVEAPDPLIGSEIGHWRIVALLGRGGMGVVYEVERADGQYRQRAALKLVPWIGSIAANERFVAERQVLARLAHPNIARLLDGGVSEDGRPYLVMEYVDGQPITEYCRSRQLSVPARLALLRVVCDAVQHAHSALVVHRDIKPDNALVSTTGDVKLLDFGVAKLLAPAGMDVPAGLTRDPTAPLTPQYAAPEQLLGQPITTATDVYALGVLAYELITGEPPIDLRGANPFELARVPPPIVPPSVRVRRRMPDVDAIVLTALRWSPDRRYASAGQLGEDLGRVLAGHPVLARKDSAFYRLQRFVARHRVGVAVVALLVAAVCGFGGIAAWEARSAARERDVARAEKQRAEDLVGVLVDVFETSNPTINPGGDTMTVREFLRVAELQIGERLTGQPARRARVQQVLGRIYAAQDRYGDARRALEEALADQRRHLGSDHPDTLETLRVLAQVLYTTGDPSAAGVRNEALTRTRALYGDDDLRTARALALFAHDSVAQGRTALAIMERTLAPDHPDLLSLQTALAKALRKHGDRAGARALYAAAMAALPDAAQRRQPAALMLMSDYATMLRADNALADAEALHHEVDTVARATLGAQSRLVAINLNNLAVLLSGQGRYADAEARFREAHAIHVALFGRTSTDTTSIARSVGTAIGMQGRWPEALVWIEESLAGLDPVRDVRPWHSRRTNLARALHRLGRSKEALRVVGEAVAALSPRVAEDGADALFEALFWHALVLIECGDVDRGENTARRAMTLLSSDGEEGIRRAGAECLVAWALIKTDRADQGRALLARALPIYAAWGRADRPTVATLQQLER